MLLLLLFLLKPASPSSTVILDRLAKQTSFPTLYYADLSGKKVRSYIPTHKGLNAETKKSISYTEGFMPQSTYTFYYELLENFTQENHLPLPTALHQFYEDEDLVVLAFSGTLKDLYIIEKDTGRVHPLSYSKTLDLGAMYVSHIQKVDTTLLILAGEQESYSALLYKVHLPTFEVVDAIKIPTHPSALSQLHYTLTSSGEAIFINGNMLKAYDTFADTYRFIPLDYTASAVIPTTEGIISLGQFKELLYYTLFDTNLTPIKHNTLTLPSPTSAPVTMLYQDQLLYIASFDPQGTRYTNYLTIYDITTGEMLYSLGLKHFATYALLDFSFN